MAEAIGQCPSVRPRAQRAMQGRRGLEGAKGTRYRGCVQASMQDVAHRTVKFQLTDHMNGL